jgi:hypothetical protein
MAKFWTSEGFEMPEKIIPSSNKWQNKLYELVEWPESSRAAKFFSFFSLTIIIM